MIKTESYSKQVTACGECKEEINEPCPNCDQDVEGTVYCDTGVHHYCEYCGEDKRHNLKP